MVRNDAPKRATDDYPKIHETMLKSLEWRRWYDYNSKVETLFDVDETQECGWMSKSHWDAFMYFVKTSSIKKGSAK